MSSPETLAEYGARQRMVAYEHGLRAGRSENERLRGDLEDYQSLLFGDGTCDHDDPVWQERVKVGAVLESILAGVYHRVSEGREGADRD